MKQKIPRGPTPPQLQVSEAQEAILRNMIRSHQTAQSLSLRAQIVLAGAVYGSRNKPIGRELGVSYQTVGTWRGRWLEGQERLKKVEAQGKKKELQEAIISLLSDEQRSGTPATFSAEQICQIIALACEEPELSERPITAWTPRELADEAIKRGIVKTISASQVRLFLKRGGLKTASKPVLAQQQTVREP